MVQLKSGKKTSKSPTVSRLQSEIGEPEDVVVASAPATPAPKSSRRKSRAPESVATQILATESIEPLQEHKPTTEAQSDHSQDAANTEAEFSAKRSKKTPKKQTKAAEEIDDDDLDLEALVKSATAVMREAVWTVVPKKPASADATALPIDDASRSLLADIEQLGSLSTSLHTPLNSEGIFIQGLSELRARKTPGPCALSSALDGDAEIMSKSVLNDDFEKQAQVPQFHIGQYAKKMIHKKNKQANDNAGSGWFNMPAAKPTPEIVQHIKILKMRSVLDPKQHFRANDNKGVPKYFQMGSFVDSAADYYSDRTPNKTKKKTLVDALLADAKFRKRAKEKFLKIQAAHDLGRRNRPMGRPSKPKAAKPTRS